LLIRFWVGFLVLAGFARRSKSLGLPKVGWQATVASLLLLVSAGSVQDASALGETRTLSFHHTHSEEDLTVTFKRNGRYDEAALQELNHYLRDWRTQGQTTMDRHLFDILWEVYRDVDGKKPIQIVSSYRSPATNAMLRRRSKGVARFSQHMLGHAMDFFIPDVPLEQIRFAGLRLQRGGVGFYPTSGSPFVHLDTGNIRHWPRMTHDQLVRVFPDGRTVHVPSDGNPLPGYQLALNDIEKRDNGDTGSSGKPSLLAALFGGKSNDDEDADAAAAAPVKPAGKPADIKSADGRSFDPAPRAKPAAATFQLASADMQQVAPPNVPKQQAADPNPAPSADAEAKPLTPADIVKARGFWGELPAAPKQASPAQVAAISARQALAAATAADPQPTSSISSFQDALAYAPPPDRNRITAGPSQHGMRAAALGRNAMAAADNATMVAQGSSDRTLPDQANVAAAATTEPVSAAGGTSDVWTRAMILAPSASTSMWSTVFGDSDMTVLRDHFIKPQAVIAMTFSDDPLMGLVSDQFTGPAVATLATVSLR
jgi:uncharacterized protein YcbK (DUF882 family)